MKRYRKALSLLLAAMLAAGAPFAAAEGTGGAPPALPMDAAPGGMPPEGLTMEGAPPEGAGNSTPDGAPPALPEGAEGMTPPENAAGMPGGMGMGSAVENSGTGATTFAQDASEENGVYASTGDEENAVRVENGAQVALTNPTVEKTAGGTSSTEDSDFYGMNAGVLARAGASLSIVGGSIMTSAAGANAAFAYGEGTTLTITDTVVRTSGNNSGGVDVTGGAALIARNLDVETQGASSAAIRSDRGGGTLDVTGGAYVTNGTGSPAVYCTADIAVTGASLAANASEAVVVEGKNSVTLLDCDATGSMQGAYGEGSGENIQAVMIYQSMSGDAQVGEAFFTMSGGSLTALRGDLFYVTNTQCTVTLAGVALTGAQGGALLRVAGNNGARGWGEAGANGGDCTLLCDGQALAGEIRVDAISSLALTLGGGSSFTGTINPDGQAGAVSVSIDESSVWTLAADAYISSFSGDLSRVQANGFQLYVNGQAQF